MTRLKNPYQKIRHSSTSPAQTNIFFMTSSYPSLLPSPVMPPMPVVPTLIDVGINPKTAEVAAVK